MRIGATEADLEVDTALHFSCFVRLSYCLARPARSLKHIDPEAIVGQPEHAIAAVHLEACTLFELAHVLDEHDRRRS